MVELSSVRLRSSAKVKGRGADSQMLYRHVSRAGCDT